MKFRHQALLGALIGSVFTFFGLAIIIIEESLVLHGIGIAAIGVVAVITTCVFGLQGRRLKVSIIDSNVVVGGYWSDRTIPLKSINLAENGVDCVIIQLSDGRVCIDETYFRDDSEIASFIEQINTKVNRTTQP